MIHRAFVVCSLLSLSLTAALGTRPASADWPQWRGPGGQGHAAARDLPETWSESENVRWRTEIHGRGWSSPVIEGNMIWVTTAIAAEAPESERERRLTGNTNPQPLHVADRVSLRAIGIERETGKRLHDVELLDVAKPQPIHTLNSYASPTPILSDGKLYCHFGTNGTACYDTRENRIEWTNQTLRIAHENGPGSSPVLWRNLLIIPCDGSDEQYIAALDARTGKLAWKTPRSGTMDENPQLKKAYGTPLIVELDGRELVLSSAANWVYAYEPETGAEVWKVAYGVLGFSIVARPVVDDGMLYVSTCFMRPELLAIRLKGPNGPEIAWKSERQVPQMPSPLLVDGLLYLVNDKGIATCLDAKTGDVVWSDRLGGNFSSSPMFADGRIYVANREGTTFVLAPGKEFRLLARNTLDGEIFATPAALDGELYYRTDKALYRLGGSRPN